MTHLPHTPAREAGPPSVRWWKPLALLGAIVGLLLLAAVPDAGQRVERLHGWIESLGPWGPVAFIMIFIVATVAMIPGTPFIAAAGGLFGAALGMVCASIATTLGAAAAFLVARYVGRDAVAKWLDGRAKLRNLDHLTERHGAWIVAVTRLVPIFPFNLLNYTFGLTRVRFGTYVFFSWLCMIPGTAVVVVGTDAIVRGIREGRVPWALVGVAAGAAALVVTLSWFARRKLRAAAAEATTPRGVHP